MLRVERGSVDGQVIVSFDNEYQASVLRNEYSYGGSAGLFEVAVLHNGHIVYDTPITCDVLGYLTAQELEDVLSRIQQLPPRTTR